MRDDLLDSLPVAHRLALSYAPRESRDAALALLALDARLAKIVRTKGESLIAQMKLTWWRDRFAQAPADWPKGEPVLAMLSLANLDLLQLSKLVDGWEQLLSEELDNDSATAFAEGRGGAWQALAGPSAAAAARQAGKEWALLDLALNLGHEDDRSAVRAIAEREPWQTPRLPKSLRPLAVLHALARRSLHRGSRDLLNGPGAMATTMRVGIFGR